MTKPDEKTLAALNVRIATLLGWTRLGHPFFEDRAPTMGLSPDPRNVATPLMELIPDFTGSLDAMHGAESKLLTGGYATQYNTELRRILGSKSWLWHAQAWQRSVALDRTLSPSPIL